MMRLLTKKLWSKAALKMNRIATSKVQTTKSPNKKDMHCQSILICHARQNEGPKATYSQKT